MSLAELFSQLALSPEALESCKKQRIEVSQLPELTKEQMQEVIPALGDRMKLAKYFSELAKPPQFEEKAASLKSPKTSKKTSVAKPGQSYLLIGNTGVGKSYIVEEMTNTRELSGMAGASTTQKCSPYPSPEGFVVVDTPGLADTDGRSLRHLNAITEYAKITPNCVPILVVQFDEKFTDQYRSCVEALSLALSLETNQYVLVINKCYDPPRVGKQEHKVNEIITQIGKLVGYLPIHTITIQLGGTFPTSKLSSIEFRPLSNVTTYDELVSIIESKHGRLALLKDRVEKAKSISILAAAGETFKGAWVNGADVLGMGSNSIQENWGDEEYFKSVAKALVLPVTAIGTRFVGTLITPVVAVAESVFDIVTAYQGALSADDRQFLEKNEAEVSKVWAKMSRVQKFYRRKY